MVCIDRLIRTNRRTVGLTITKEGLLEVRAPKKMSEGQIRQLVEEKSRWIESARVRQAERRERAPRHAYREGEVFLYLGAPLQLRYARGAAIHLQGDALFVPDAPPEMLRKLLEDWYKQEARSVFSKRLAHFAPLFGVEVPSLRLSGAATRWGSLGRGINLNWRLMMAPPMIIDYVVAHELAHIKNRNHSGAFWQCLGRVMPDYEERRRWLTQNGCLLTLDMGSEGGTG